jgi:hypothetical protein
MTDLDRLLADYEERDRNSCPPSEARRRLIAALRVAVEQVRTANALINAEYGDGPDYVDEAAILAALRGDT